jgi:protein involved in polysaccharide export with SLBB domain
VKRIKTQFLVFVEKNAVRFVVAVGLLILSTLGYSQQPLSSPIPPNTGGTASSPVPPYTGGTAGVAVGSQQQNSDDLTSSQILAIIQQKPELEIDLKKVMADYLSQQKNTPMQQGTAPNPQSATVDENSITDEMLYNGIVSSPGLRASMTAWLRSRGYVSDVALERSKERTADDEEGQEEHSGAQSTSPTASIPPFDGNFLGIDSNTASLGDSGKTDFTAKQDAASEPSSEKQNRQSKRPGNPSFDAIEVLHEPTPYNLQSLRDLYTQVPEQGAKLRRFGSDMFLNRGMATKQMVIDVPVGPDYVLGPGDGLTINLWGGVSQNFSRVVDREGKIVLPEAGTVVVAGLSLKQTQSLVQNALSQQFRDARVSVSVGHLRTVRVYVVGDVQRPGAYDISSLSTPLNALYAAGGPTSIGSLRTVRQYRGKTLIREVDLYDFLLHGVRADVERLEPGDTILVPPAGPQVAVAGMVKRPAIYEFKGEVKLSDVLNEAGGTLVSAALTHITVERIDAQGHRVTLSPPVTEGETPDGISKEINSFTIRDGDRVSVAPILPYSEKAVYMEGHVVRPGRYPYRDGMMLDEVIRTYQDLLPEPAQHGQIIRLMPPDLHAEAIDFDVPEVLAGNEPVHLQPFDTIRILGRYEADPPKVTVRGEVLRPGNYALPEGMTVAQLVRMAGGFKRSALLDEADLVSYDLKDGKHVVSKRTSIDIGRAVKNSGGSEDATLKPGDVLTVHQVTGWSDIGASIVLNGEVTYPGSYGLKEGERLSSVLLRAGGFRTTAYPAGAVLVRASVKELEEKSRAELIRQLESASAGARLEPSITGVGDAATLQILSQQQNEMIQKLRNQTSIGRLIIKIGPDIASWAGTAADIELRSGDVLTIPKRPGFILVSGQVYNATAITYVPGKNAGWYLKHAGGSTELSNRKEILIIRANGSVVGRRSGDWYDPGVLSTRLDPGDVVVVPEKIFGGGVFWRNLVSVAQIASSIGFTAALALH